MSSKTRTRKTTTTGSAPTLRAVPVSDTAAMVRTDTEDKLWEALHTHPNSTAADLAAAAKIGKSTAGKILARWQKDGSVTRTPGIAEGGRRAADLWAITVTDHIPEADAPDVLPDDVPKANVAVEETSTDTAQDGPTAVSTDPETAEANDATLAQEDLAESGNAGPTNVPADRAQEAADGTTDAEPEATEPATTEPVTASARSTDTTTDDTTETASGGDKKAARLAPGALRGMVEDYLRDYPGEEFGPTRIARDLGGKSSGAVSNALDKLVADGTAVKTGDKPRRFTLAPAERTVAPTPTN